jgi:hypothetical protein
MKRLFDLALRVAFGCSRFLLFAQGSASGSAGDWLTLRRRCRRLT